MQLWTVEQVAERFKQAVQIARCLPTPCAKGFTGCWELILQQKKLYDGLDDRKSYYPPSEDAVDLLLETCTNFLKLG